VNSISVDWISVDVQLPEDDIEVIICGCKNNGKRGIGFTTFNKKRGWDLYSCDFDKVYYWLYYSAHLPHFECENYSCEPLVIPSEVKSKSYWKKFFG